MYGLKKRKKLVHTSVQEILRFAKVWERVIVIIVCNLPLAYAKRLFLDSRPWPPRHNFTIAPGKNVKMHYLCSFL